MNWKNFGITLSGMCGFFLIYKFITLSLLYSFSGLQSKPYYQFIYFGIVLIITAIIFKISRRVFSQSISTKLNLGNLKKQWSVLLIPFLLYGVDFFAILSDIGKHSFYIFVVSVLSALGAGLFEETRDRGFGIIGFNLAFKNSKWKPMFIALTTSLLFSSSHYLNLLMPNSPTLNAVNQQVVYTFFLGLCLSVIVMRTGSIFYSILFHFTNNFAFWTPVSDLSQDSPWSAIIIGFIISFLYSMWCLRPSKAKVNMKYLSE